MEQSGHSFSLEGRNPKFSTLWSKWQQQHHNNKQKGITLFRPSGQGLPFYHCSLLLENNLKIKVCCMTPGWTGTLKKSRVLTGVSRILAKFFILTCIQAASVQCSTWVRNVQALWDSSPRSTESGRFGCLNVFNPVYTWVDRGIISHRLQPKFLVVVARLGCIGRVYYSLWTMHIYRKLCSFHCSAEREQWCSLISHIHIQADTQIDLWSNKQ